MSESFVQLPTDGSGKQIRMLEGDGTTTLIPANVYEEVVIPSDSQGVVAGDSRQLSLATRDDAVATQLREIRAALDRIAFILRAGLDVDVNDEDTTNDYGG